MTTPAFPPGPKYLLPRGFLFALYRDTLGLLVKIARQYGDIAHTRVGANHWYLLNHPDYLRDVLVTHSRNFPKTRNNAKEWDLFLGKGLLNSEGDFHLHQRRIMERAFHGERVAGYGAVMVEYADRLGRHWQPGAVVDIHHEMMQLALSIAGKALFDIDVGSEVVEEVSRSLADVVRFASMLRLPFAHLLEKLPLPITRHFFAAHDRLNAIIFRLIDEHRRHGQDKGDLLSILLTAEVGEGMSDQQVRDEALTMLMAGHETTANSLAFTWHLLSQHPDVEGKLQAELADVLGGRLPTLADIPRLIYTEKVFRESLRLYPPGWVITRQAVEDCEVGGWTIPAGGILVLSEYVLHRHPRYFPEPERFDPDRWTPEFRAQLHPYAYIPFGGGPRKCIGEHFAWMEAALVLATLAQRWRPRLVPGFHVVADPVIMLRPKNGIRMILEAR